MKPNLNARACAAQAIFAVLEQGRSLSESLSHAQSRCINGKDKGLIAELSYGVLRWLPQLDHQVSTHIKKPLKGNKRVLHHLLLVGCYQLNHTRIPSHAAVSETVEASRQLGGKNLSGMINGVLRSLQRAQEAPDSEPTWPSPVLEHAHPKWLIEQLQQDHPSKWQAILHQNNQRPPMWLRINQRQLTAQDYLAHLTAQQIDAEATTLGTDALRLAEPCDVHQLPGYEEGWFAVQDLAAQQAAALLPVPTQQDVPFRALDICAAPGGKTCHWQERADNQLQLLAIDIDQTRLDRVAQNLSRLQLSAELLAADAASSTWWDGEPFQAILLDAPCSATGVIRRHPDIKWLRQRNDIAQLAELQQQILENAWKMLAPGGTLVYATCSVLKLENQQQISDFLLKHADAQLVPIQPGETPQSPGWQILPGEEQMDGFYYARLIKRA